MEETKNDRPNRKDKKFDLLMCKLRKNTIILTRIWRYHREVNRQIRSRERYRMIKKQMKLI
jgi:hypothetical protein